MRPPDSASVRSLVPLVPTFLGYVLSFVYIASYWNNHHHMLSVTRRVSASILWANLHLLFWLSLIPFATAWMGQHGIASAPTALYGSVLLMAAIAYYVLERVIILNQGADSQLREALGRDYRGRISPLLYALTIPVAYYFPWAGYVAYALLAVFWLMPNRGIERATGSEE